LSSRNRPQERRAGGG
jgi:dephospho-CoA kinase